MSFKSVRVWARHLLRPMTFTLAGLIVVGILLFFRLHNLLPNLSSAEIATRNSSLSIRTILLNPVNAPYKILVYGLLHIKAHSVLALRLVSALYGLLTAVVFFLILRYWQGVRIALLGTMLFVSSSWFLTIARVGTPEILELGLLGVVGAGFWLRVGRNRLGSFYACIAALAIALYIPGLIWFALLGLLWRRAVISREVRKIRWLPLTVGIGLFALAALPAGFAIAHNPHVGLSLLGLPQHIPTIRAVGNNLLNIPRFLFWRGPQRPDVWLSRTAILDVLASVMFVLGLYAYFRARQLDRTQLFAGIVVVGSALIAIGGGVTISLLIPFIYLVIAQGIMYMLQQWFSVFPINPVARTIGVTVLIGAVLISTGYQLDRYFVAWAHDPSTQAVYNQRP